MQSVERGRAIRDVLGRAAAVGERLARMKQCGVDELRRERVRQRRTLGRREAQAQRLEAIDVRGGVVDGAVVRDGIRAAIGNGQECVAARVREAGTQAAQQVAGRAVFEGTCGRA
jgi:hypothetical protein